MSEWGSRADEAAQSVRALFGRRLLGMPFTHLARVDYPIARPTRGPWHYWWQAHYIDALVDESLRHHRAGSHDHARTITRLARRTLATVGIRNVFQFPNHYYDDMAWLLLAAQRVAVLDDLDALDLLDSPALPRLPRPVLTTAARSLRHRVLAGDTPDLGGGVFWNDDHDFKNVPATAPVALFRARIGDLAGAARLIDWIYDHLHDPTTGLLMDGIRMLPGAQTMVVPHVFTYNQGTVLAVLTELAEAGHPGAATRAARLVDAIATHLTRADDPDAQGLSPNALRVHGDGDGGLFTGILVRYLALAARSPGLEDATRQSAAHLVRTNAQLFWDGRQSRSLPRRFGMPHAQVFVFSPDPARPASETQPHGIPVELSTQVQAWTTLEAAAALNDAPPARNPRPRRRFGWQPS